MTSQSVIFDLVDTADERFDGAIEAMLVAMLALAPLAMGAVHPWSEMGFVAAAGAMALLLAGKLLARPHVPFVRTWAYVPMLAFAALVLFQLVPLPAGLVKLISPGTYELRSQLLASVPGSAEHLSSMPLSIYPEDTLGQFRLMLAVGAVFVVALNVARRLEQIKRMLAAITIIGAAMALLALAQNITDARAIYWTFPIESNRATSGPFEHHGHFAQFMNLSMAAALGLMLIHFDQLPRRRADDGRPRAVQAFTRPVTRPIWMLACAVVAMAVCVPLSLSRTGMLAMLAGSAVTAGVVATRRGWHGRTWIFVGLVLAALSVLLLVQFDEVMERASSIRHSESLGGRIEILRGSMVLWREFPVMGTGLGTFGAIFSMFDPSAIVKTAEHAENEYAQLLVETGALGIALMLVFLLVVAGAYVRCVRGAPSPMASGAMGLGFGIVAILVHSAGDFGQHVPAVAALSAVTLAIVINLAEATRRRDAMPDSFTPRARRWPRVVGALVVFAVAGLSIFDALQVLRADLHRQAAVEIEGSLAQDNWQGSDLQFAELIVAADRATRIRPRNVVYRYELNWYRWKALARSIEPRLPDATTEDADLRDVRRVIEELLICPHLAPTYSPPYLLAGQLLRTLFEGGATDGTGAALIRTARRIEPNNPQTLIANAILAAQAQRSDEAATMLRRAMRLSADHREDVIDVAIDELDRPEPALKLAGEDRALLLRVAMRLEERGAWSEVAKMARERADEILLRQAADPDAPASTLAEAAELALRQEDPATAIALLRRATTMDFAAHDIRLNLAKAMVSDGQLDEAVAELRLIIRQSPTHARALALLKELEAPVTRPADSAIIPSVSAPPPTTQPGFKLE